MDISVIIVNYNVKYFLEQCVLSLRKAAVGLDAEIWVVDNQSADGSRPYLEDRFREVKFIWNTHNAGFAQANNMALRLATGRYILFLNPDTLLPEDALKKSIRYLDADSGIGALGMKMLDGSGKFLKESKRGFPNPDVAFYKLTGFTALFPRSREFGRYYLGWLDEDLNHPVEVLSGAFMMIKKQVLDTVGGFDEKFFMYGEDIDLSYRIREAGWQNHYFSETPILHFKGESTRKGSFKYLINFYGAMRIFAKKYQKGRGTLLLLFFMQIAIWLRVLVAALFQFMNQLFHWAFPKGEAPSQPTLVAGNESEYESLLLLEKEIGLKDEIIGRVPSEGGNPSSLVDGIKKMHKRLQKNKTLKVIFCAGSLSYQQIINAAGRASGAFRIRIHAHGSGSIVGSDSKNNKGEANGIQV